MNHGWVAGGGHGGGTCLRIRPSVVRLAEMANLDIRIINVRKTEFLPKF